MRGVIPARRHFLCSSPFLVAPADSPRTFEVVIMMLNVIAQACMTGSSCGGCCSVKLLSNPITPKALGMEGEVDVAPGASHSSPARDHTGMPRPEIDLRGAVLACLKPCVTSTKICLTSFPRKVKLYSAAADSGRGDAAELLRGWDAVSACPATKDTRFPSVPPAAVQHQPS